MKKITLKRALCVLLAGSMAFGVAACGGSSGGSSSPAPAGDGAAASTPIPEGKPDTWIADRHIVVRTFDEDIGLQEPEDQVNNEVAQKIKELTGMTMEIQYTSGPSSLESLTTAISAGDLPDAFSYYLNDSTRPEYPVVLKAAREGMLTDLAPYLRESKVYSKYYEDGYLPADTYNNIIQREEFGGATYHVHMRMKRKADMEELDKRGGMYIQKSVVDALDIKPDAVKTTDDLYNLLVKIKEAGLTDTFGNPMTPLGPSYWGGGNGENVRQYLIQQYIVDNDLWDYTDGKVTNLFQSDEIHNLVAFVRKLLGEELMHKEFFTMDSARTAEGALSGSFAIIEDVHSGMTKELFDKVDYVPLGDMVDKYGHYYYYKNGRSGYGAWSIPTTTKNPEEIVKFADFLASKEGKLLWQYGIEGEHYDMKDGKPFVKQEVLDQSEEEPTYLQNLNIWGNGRGSLWGSLFGNTDMNMLEDFGELDYGLNTNPDKYETQTALNDYGLDVRPYEKRIIREGFHADHFITEFEEQGGSSDLRSLILKSNYSSMLIKAFFAKSDDEAKAIVDNYREQLGKAGLDEFCEFVTQKKQENPDMIYIPGRDI